MQKSVSSVTAGRHHLPASASRAADCATSSAASASAQAASPAASSSVRAHNAEKTMRSRAAARSAASLIRRSSSDRSGAVKRAPFAMPCRSTSSGNARSFSTLAAAASIT